MDLCRERGACTIEVVEEMFTMVTGVGVQQVGWCKKRNSRFRVCYTYGRWSVLNALHVIISQRHS